MSMATHHLLLLLVTFGLAGWAETPQPGKSWWGPERRYKRDSCAVQRSFKVEQGFAQWRPF